MHLSFEDSLRGAQAKVPVANIDESVINRFARHRCRCPGDRRGTHVSVRYVRRVRRFVEFLGKRGVVQQQAMRAVPALDRRVVKFQDWLRHHRGIAETSESEPEVERCPRDEDEGGGLRERPRRHPEAGCPTID